MPLWIRYDGLEAGGQRGSDVIINQAPPVSTDVRYDRTDRLGRDGQLAGVDLISKRVWDFTLFTNLRTEDEAIATAGDWQRAWEDPDVRGGRRLVPLEYSRDRQSWFRVYGRPGLFTPPEPDVLTRQGRGQIDLQFEQLDPLHYSEFDERVSLAVAGGASGGFIFPLTFPWEFATSAAAVERWATNNGENPAPVSLRFDGPLSDPVVELVGQWRFALSGTLAYDEYLIVDTRRTPASINIYSTTRPGHRAAFSWIRDGSRFTDLVIPPGQHALSFAADDPTFTGSMTASWPHTFQSMQ